WQGGQARGSGQGLRCYGKIGLLMKHHLSQRGRITFCQGNSNLGKTLAKGGYDLGQDIAGLRVRAAYDHPALVPMREFVADLLQVVHFTHDAVNDLRHHRTRLGQPFDSLAVALEDLDAEFILEFDDGLGHPWLRSEQRTRRFCKIEVATDGFTYESELLQVHDG